MSQELEKQWSSDLVSSTSRGKVDGLVDNYYEVLRTSFNEVVTICDELRKIVGKEYWTSFAFEELGIERTKAKRIARVIDIVTPQRLRGLTIDQSAVIMLCEEACPRSIMDEFLDLAQYKHVRRADVLEAKNHPQLGWGVQAGKLPDTLPSEGDTQGGKAGGGDSESAPPADELPSASENSGWSAEESSTDNEERSGPVSASVPVTGELIDERTPEGEEEEPFALSSFESQIDGIVAEAKKSGQLINLIKAVWSACDEAQKVMVETVLGFKIEEKPQEQQKQLIDTVPTLDEVVAWWNELAKGIRCRRVTKTSNILQRDYGQMLKNEELRPLFLDLNKLGEEIKASEFVHGQSWFSLTKLLKGKNKDGEWIALKLWEGGYLPDTHDPYMKGSEAEKVAQRRKPRKDSAAEREEKEAKRREREKLNAQRQKEAEERAKRYEEEQAQREEAEQTSHHDLVDQSEQSEDDRRAMIQKQLQELGVEQ